MAYKKNKKKPKMYRGKKRYRKYSFFDRDEYYQKKAMSGKTDKERDFAYGYLDGMRGVQSNLEESKACQAGNKAGLRFWSNLKLTKI